MTQAPPLDRSPSDRIHQSRPRRVGRLAPLLVACVLVVAGLSSLTRPSVRGADTPLAEFGAIRADTHLARIAVEPHPLGSPSLRLVESYITGQLVGMGLQPEVQPTEVPDYFGPRGSTTEARNVIAVIPGTAPTTALALVAHYDTHPATPGANDNSVGVAVLLEVARAVVAGEQSRNDIILLFTDGEEPNPRYGANAFAERYERFGDIGLVVNLEAIGSTGPSLLVEVGDQERGIVERYRAVADDPAAFSFLTDTVDLFGGVGTDFDVFKQRDVPGLSFAYLRGSSIYHTERDDIDSVSTASVQHHGDNVMAAVRAFGSTELSARAGADVVFFRLTPWLTFGYSELICLGLAALTVAGLVVVAFRRLRSNRDSLGSIGRGALVLVLGSLASAIAVFGVWWLLTAVRTTPGVWESYGYAALLTVVSAAVLSLVGGGLAGRHGDSQLATGIVAVWVVLGVLTSLLLPGFSYVFMWPALGGVVALAASSSGRASDWLWLAVAAPAVVLSIPALDAFFQMAQPRPGNPDSDLTPTVAVAGMLVALIVGLIVPFLPAGRRR